MKKIKKMLLRIRRSEQGQGMVEYGLILALVSVVAIGALGGIGDAVKDTFANTAGTLDSRVAVVDNLVRNENHIPIATAEELNSIRTNEKQTFGQGTKLEGFGQGTKWEGKYESGLNNKYVQVEDIDLSSVPNFEAIGPDSDSPFTGTYDGGGYMISNLTINRPSSNTQGLFGRVAGGTLKNIKLEGGSVRGNSGVGGLVGQASNKTSITNSYTSVAVNGISRVGGLVGVTGSSSSIKNAYASGAVTGSGNYVGGLVGYADHNTTITNTYASGAVTGNIRVGGLVGRASDDTISILNSYWDKETTNQDSSDGGKGEGKTTDDMKLKASYTGWNFGSIWQINEGQYPTLR